VTAESETNVPISPLFGVSDDATSEISLGAVNRFAFLVAMLEKVLSSAGVDNVTIQAVVTEYAKSLLHVHEWNSQVGLSDPESEKPNE